MHPITALQTEYSLFTRDVEREILPTCRELGIGFVAYSPLGRGILTGAISGLTDLAENDRRRDHPRWHADNIASNLRLAQPVRDAAGKAGITPAQLAIAWVLSRGGDIVPIPGTHKSARLEENLATLGKRVEKRTLDGLTESIDATAVKGTRYPAGQMKGLGI